MEKLIKKADEFISSLKKDQSAVIICSNDDGEFNYTSYTSVNNMAAAIATILDDYLNDNKEEARTVAEGIVRGVCAYIESGNGGSLQVASQVAHACTLALKNQLSDLKDKLATLDDDEDCEHCDSVTDCPLPAAVKFRKHNRLSAPKKRKNGKCGDKKNENVN